MSEENNGSSGDDGSGGETASWGGQDGWIIESDGMAKYLCREGEEYAIYQLDGTYVLGEMLEVVAGASTTFIGGAEVNVITPLEATIFLGFGINWNVAAKHIPKSAGCTPREREAFGVLLADGPYVDCFRQLHPDAQGVFSYWSTRSGGQLLNRGLRLDYAVASAALAKEGGPLTLHECAYMSEYAPNGDHAPTLVALKRV